MAQRLILNAWSYGLIGIGIGVLLSHAAHGLLRYRIQHTGQPPLGARGRSALAAGRRPARLDIGLALVSGAGFAGLWWRTGPSIQTVISSAYFSLFLLILVLDITHRWVPDILLLPTAVVALAVSALSGQPSFDRALLGGLAGFVCFYVIAIAYRGALGAGDVKLAGVIGLMTGFPDVFLALTIGIAMGGVAAAALLIAGRATRKSFMPYAPFLVAGALVALVFGTQIASEFAKLSG